MGSYVFKNGQRRGIDRGKRGSGDGLFASDQWGESMGGYFGLLVGATLVEDCDWVVLGIGAVHAVGWRH